MKKIIGLGACVLDTIISCDRYPVEDTKQKAENIFIAGGGPVANALVIASKLDVPCAILNAFADDEAGKFMLSDFNKYSVDTDNVVTVKGAKSFTSYIVLSEENKTRTCVFDRGTIKDDPNLLNYDCIKDYDVLHLDGNYLNCALTAAKFAKENGVKVCLDAGGLYSGIENLLPLVDILIPSAEFAMGITKTYDIKSAIIALKDIYNPEILVVTDGVNGGYYMTENGPVHYDSVKVNAVDTNGAGDTFHGAFLVAYVDGLSIKECCAFASKVAAHKCSNKGVRTYPLSKEIIANF